MYSGAKRTEVEAFLEPSMKTHTKERGRRNNREHRKKHKGTRDKEETIPREELAGMSAKLISGAYPSTSP